MNKSLSSCFRRNANLHWGLWALAAAVGPAMAQPTGNPKGTAPLSAEGNSAKPPATRKRDAGRPEERRVEGAESSTPKAVREGHLRTPGVGTAGGLTGRHPGDGSTNRTTQTDQAPPVKKP
ncbi:MULTISPECIES: hypothetical protein [unclassified Variovorax]|uniref:hypothetical protein n=1 Tax=unclassified Variovorax TaxID=663243 RepID=UPI00076D263E|nr:MULTISPECIES: hypothetical protein [unclassified Variovorax]KWT97001.1 hypothetical protein APY03_2003 [Variovorax sp. WDL1]PNG58557.1 hypothetical protein CHC07_00282 [Variovorax sp. B4]PNG61653.1 hypothetical protein CHC06_01554 [Variovorax sp. B2]VTV12304.1 hypothetical protein WDL1CHR_03111 [Variovorax sp. WDL1]